MTKGGDGEAVEGELLMVPLGGAGEIGMNLTLYCYEGRWLAVDLGITFGDDSTPGIDVIVPDISFLTERRHALDGIVLTHGHEDHLGAIPYLWGQLGCPVYATPFTAALLRRKLEREDFGDMVPLHEVPSGDSVRVGPFEVQFIPAAHSIPEAHVLAIRTSAGTVVHATDWKLDPAPLVGPVTDEAALKKVGDEGVLAMACDSTNVFVPGRAKSEADLRKSLVDIIGQCDRRVAVASFASNVARMETVAAAAEASGRSAALVGRSLWRIYDVARETGYLKDTKFLSEEEAAFMPPEKIVMCVTGSQGEPRSAMSRIAADDHPHIVLDEGDVAIFSSRMIPGNELAIGRLHNQLARLGVEVITEDDEFVHVSGHPARDELSRMYELIRPQTLIPIHGEARHLFEQSLLAEEKGIPNVVVAENGSIVRLAPGTPELDHEVRAGRMAVDGKRMIPIDSNVIRTRNRIRFGGAAVATVVLDKNGRLLDDPRLTVYGLLDEEREEAVVSDVLEALAAAIEKMPRDARQLDEEVERVARSAVRRVLRDAVGKRPVTDIHVVRI